MLVLQPLGGALSVGVRWSEDRLTWLVRAGVARAADGGFAIAPSALVMDDFARERWLVDGAAVSESDFAAHEPPALEAVVELYDRALEAPLVVPMVCNALWTKPGLALVWRGDVAAEDIGERDRAVVTLGALRPLAERLGARARASVSFALESKDLGAEPDPTDADILALERMALADDAPQPTLTLDAYATIAAEIAEQRAPLARVLERHGLDEAGWALEERAWLERMAQSLMEGDAELAASWGDRFVAAQDALGSREEQDAMIHEYAAVSAELERADDPMLVLRRWGLSLAEWMRLDRHWSRAAAADPRVRDELERMLAQERARHGEGEA
jgi:hypothetical protein